MGPDQYGFQQSKSRTWESSLKLLLCCYSLSCPTLVIPWTIAAKLPCPWKLLGENAGVGCHFLLQGIFINMTQALNQCSILIRREKNRLQTVCPLLPIL